MKCTITTRAVNLSFTLLEQSVLAQVVRIMVVSNLSFLFPYGSFLISIKTVACTVFS